MKDIKLNGKDTDMELDMFAQLSAIKGTQFNQDIYSSVLKFKDFEKFLSVFKEVQRDVNQRKVGSIKRYILSGLEEGIETMRFFSGVTCTNRGKIFYDETNHRIAINTAESKLSLNDGQHRYYATIAAIKQLEKDFVKSKDKKKTEKIRRQLNALKEMSIPIVIFDGLSEKEEAQLFFDLNSLAQRPSRSATIKLNQNGFLPKLTLEISRNNRYLKHYGVEESKSFIHKNNTNAFLLTTIYDSIKEMFSHELQSNSSYITQDNYEEVYKVVDKTLNSIFLALPGDLNTKNKYLLEKNFALKAICRFVSDSRKHLDKMYPDDVIFSAIERVDWTHNIEFWRKYNAAVGNENKLAFYRGVNGGLNSVYSALEDAVIQ